MHEGDKFQIKKYRAGRKVLKYVEQIEYRGNEHDLKGDIFDQIDAKEILGICDYDAIGLGQNTNNAVLIATEFFHASLGASQLVGYPSVNSAGGSR